MYSVFGLRSSFVLLRASFCSEMNFFNEGGHGAVDDDQYSPAREVIPCPHSQGGQAYINQYGPDFTPFTGDEAAPVSIPTEINYPNS